MKKPILSFLLMAGISSAERPNILVIVTDDMGYGDVGFNGSSDIRTPALDQLAENGTVCTSGYAAHPFCGPSRAGLMTGRYPHELGAQYNLPRNSDTIVGFGVPRTEIFLSTALQDAGYYTGAIGKWHLGAEDDYAPNARGFDDFYGFRGGGHKYFPAKFHAEYDKQVKAGREVIIDNICPLERNGHFVRETEYLTDAFSREAVRFVKEAAQKEQPFFLYLAYNAPHSPMEALEQDLERYAHIEDKTRRTYAAMVYAVDRGVAQLTRTLKEMGVFDNTLIVFMSDNGGKLRYGSDNGPLKGEKADCAEGGYRVPMFFHWPTQIPAGQIYEHPVSALDFYPTLITAAGASVPSGKKLSGRNVLPALQSGKSARTGQLLFSMRYEGESTQVGIRQDQWKALRYKGKWGLYDLGNDIGEQHDVSKLYPERLSNMLAKAKGWSRVHTPPKWKHDQVKDQEWDPEVPDFDQLFERD